VIMRGQYGTTSVYQVELAEDMTPGDVWIPPRTMPPLLEELAPVRHVGPTEELECVLDRVVAYTHGCISGNSGYEGDAGRDHCTVELQPGPPT
jgi:hypothetical protein